MSEARVGRLRVPARRHLAPRLIVVLALAGSLAAALAGASADVTAGLAAGVMADVTADVTAGLAAGVAGPGFDPFDGPAVSAVATSAPVLVGAGDIATCRGSGDGATAALLASIPGTVFTAGDNAYDSGRAAEYARCYGPTWGVFRPRTRPAPGNHDYATTGAAGYFGYFGARAGDPRRGYYAYNLGSWRIYVLNSNCWAVGGCAAGSPQERWLRANLAASPHRCVLAYWHHPLFSSGLHGNQSAVRAFWNDLQAAGAEIVINGHDHDYERFAPQTPGGVASATGIREFVVGTGGRSHYGFGVVRRNSQVRNARAFGVLRLTLRAGSYDWRFVPAAGTKFSDAGHGTCR